MPVFCRYSLPSRHKSTFDRAVKCASYEVPKRFLFIYLLGRPTQSASVLGFTTVVFLLLFRQPLSKLTELNSTKLCCMFGKWARFENACPKFGVSPRLKIGGPKTTYFRHFRQLHKFVANILRQKHGVDNLGNGVKNCKWCATVPQNFVNFGLETAYNSTSIFTHPT